MSDPLHTQEVGFHSFMAPFIKRKWLILFSLSSIVFLYVTLVLSRQHYDCTYKDSPQTHKIMAPSYYTEKEIHRKAKMVCMFYSPQDVHCEVKSCKVSAE